jgi:hypothetical protein
MRSAGVLTVSIPLPRVYLRHVWSSDRRGCHRQRLRSRASSPPGPAPAPPRGRASAGAARRLCGDMHAVFTRHCAVLLTKTLKSCSTAMRAHLDAPRLHGRCAPRGLCEHGAHGRNLASAADSASACCSGTAAHVVSATNPRPRSIGAGFGRHGVGLHAHEPGSSWGDANLVIEEWFRTDLA